MANLSYLVWYFVFFTDTDIGIKIVNLLTFKFMRSISCTACSHVVGFFVWFWYVSDVLSYRMVTLHTENYIKWHFQERKWVLPTWFVVYNVVVFWNISSHSRMTFESTLFQYCASNFIACSSGISELYDFVLVTFTSLSTPFSSDFRRIPEIKCQYYQKRVPFFSVVL